MYCSICVLLQRIRHASAPKPRDLAALFGFGASFNEGRVLAPAKAGSSNEAVPLDTSRPRQRRHPARSARFNLQVPLELVLLALNYP
jgi:hypothetical protein